MVAPTRAAPRVWQGPTQWLRRLATDPGVRLAVLMVVAMRLVLGVAGVAGIAVAPADRPSGDHLDVATPRQAGLWPLVGPFERWDALWYLHIVRDGYAPRTGDGAYEPLFPSLVRIVSWPLGGDISLAAWLTVTVALVVALAVVWHLVAARFGSRVATLAVLGMAVYPCAFFLLSPYPEPVFLALSAGTFLAASRRRWAVAGLLAALTALCRPQGAVVILAVAVEAMVAARAAATEGGAPPRGLRPLVTLRHVQPAMLAACAVPAGVLLAWFAVCRSRLDLPLGPLSPLRDVWGHHAAWPWQVMADSIHRIGTGQRTEEIGNLAAVALVAAMLPLMWRALPPSWTVYTAATLAIALGGEAAWTPLMSWMRYAAVLFPAFTLLALALVRLPPWLRWVTAAVALGFQMYLFQLYIHFTFVA